MKSRLLCAGVLAATLAAPQAWAAAKFTISVVDDPGVGFNDTTPATPVGGNPGTTVGEQRLKVFQAAGDAWGRILDSTVPIVVEASFAPLECEGGMAVLGQAAPYAISNSASLPTKDSYPTALANKILGKDVATGSPDITSQFNGGLFDCLGIDWYYGLDGLATTKQVNLLTVLIHEMTHGLGFTDGVDPTTGAFSRAPSVFSYFVLDNKTGKHFSEMTNAERKTALTDVRGLVWDGKRTDAVAARLLAKGTPSLKIEPAPSGFAGFVGEANFGRLLADGAAVSGSLAVGTISSGCTGVTGSFSGKIAVLTSPISPTPCASLSAASRVEAAGAIAMLFAYDEVGSPPTVALEFRKSDIARFTVTIPTLAVTQADAALLKNASSAVATMSADTSKLVGADAAGHAMLFGSNPIQPGSTGPHWDPLVRPNPIMEPVDLPNPITYLDMERALLWDIGWTGDCGNGTLDGQEACDDGAANSDYLPDACRLDCTKPRCGDGVVDKGEQCDPGGNGKLADPGCDTSCRQQAVVGTGGASGVGGGSGRGGASGRGAGGGYGSGGTPDLGGVGGITAGGGASYGGTGGSASGGGSGDPGAGGAAGGAGSTTRVGGKSSGCSCRTGRGDGHGGASAMVVGLGLLLCLRRRRRGGAA